VRGRSSLRQVRVMPNNSKTMTSHLEQKHGSDGYSVPVQDLKPDHPQSPRAAKQEGLPNHQAEAVHAAHGGPVMVQAGDTASRAASQRCSSFGFELTEPTLMQRAFGNMLHRLFAFQQETERANQAKRHFIRYIFHEVRVPFNSVVLCK